MRRSDGSGTTFIWTNYLSKVSPEWEDKVGSSTAVAWPEGVGGKGNEGVSAYVQRIKGAIGYVEYAYARKSGWTYALVANKAGEYVQPDIASFQAAAAYADWKTAPGFYVIITDQPGKADLAHRWRDLRPAAQDPGQSGKRGAGNEVLRLVLQSWGSRWPSRSTTFRYRTMSSR